jgi:hypothetical protein
VSRVSSQVVVSVAWISEGFLEILALVSVLGGDLGRVLALWGACLVVVLVSKVGHGSLSLRSCW